MWHLSEVLLRQKWNSRCVNSGHLFQAVCHCNTTHFLSSATQSLERVFGHEMHCICPFQQHTRCTGHCNLLFTPNCREMQRTSRKIDSSFLRVSSWWDVSVGNFSTIIPNFLSISGTFSARSKSVLMEAEKEYQHVVVSWHKCGILFYGTSWTSRFDRSAIFALECSS